MALYGFPTEEAYNAYRAQMGSDPEAAPVIARFAVPPFHSYERIFLTPLPPLP